MSKPTAHKTPVVAVLNMKGGVGKTTISANIFRVLYKQKNASTLLIDLDPQFNLTQALFTRSHYENLKKDNKTIISVMESPPPTSMFEVNTSTTPPPSTEDIGYRLRYLSSAPNTKLIIIPGDFGLARYSLMDDNKKLNSIRARFLRFVTEAQSKFKTICIDCNPSSSFLTLCALQAATHVLVPVRPDRYSILGLELLSEFINSIISIPQKPKIIVLLNGIPRNMKKVTAVEAALRAHPTFGPATMLNRLFHSSLLVAHPDYTGFATDKKVSNSGRLNSEIAMIVDELSVKLGLP